MVNYRDFFLYLYLKYLDFNYFWFSIFNRNHVLGFKTENNFIWIKGLRIVKSNQILECNDEINKHILFLNKYELKNRRKINIDVLWSFLEKEYKGIDGLYLIWMFDQDEYITYYDKGMIGNEIKFPFYFYDEYKGILKKQEELFSNGILMAVDNLGNDITVEVKKYAGPLENFKMYSNTDLFLFRRMLFNMNELGNEYYLFDIVDYFVITDKEINEIKINKESERWVHNEEDSQKHLDDLFKESMCHSVETSRLEELASKSTLKEMIYDNISYYSNLVKNIIFRKNRK